MSENFCRVCVIFASNDTTKFKKYISEKIDWRSIDSFRRAVQLPGVNQKKGMQKNEAMTESIYGTSQADNARRGIEGLQQWLEKDGFTFKNGRLVPVGNTGSVAVNTITEVTRRNIEDFFTVANVGWWGRLGQADFLSRLYDLYSMPSSDPKFESAWHDIVQHTEFNDDWTADWVFYDSRFDLRQCPDDVFLRFLAEALHPVVQADPEEVTRLVTEFNTRLKADGWKLAASGELSGRPLYIGERIGSLVLPTLVHAKVVAEVLDANYLARQIQRMEHALGVDVELAIGTAKEFTETICKTILEKSGLSAPTKDDLPKLVKQTMKQLKLTPAEIPNAARGADTIRVLLSNLATVVKGLAELRNLYGSGHGKHAESGGLGLRHAKLAVGAATTLGVFLFDTYMDRSDADQRNEPPKGQDYGELNRIPQGSP